MQAKHKDVLLLVARLIVGGVFILTGWMKVTDMGSTVGYFAQLGIPAFLAYIVSYVELIGGALVILGMWSCLVSAILAVIMIFAVWFSRGAGVAGMMGPLAILASLLSFMASGSGKYAVKCKKHGDNMAA